MSNRKHRTNRADFLYLLARGFVSNAYFPHLRIHKELLKDGLVEVKREVTNRKIRWSRLHLTKKGYELLLKRSRGHNRNIRVHRDLHRLICWREDRNMIELTLNEDPRDWLAIMARGIGI